MSSNSFWRNIANKVFASLITAGILAVIGWAWPMVPTEYRFLLILGGLFTIILTWIVALLYKGIRQRIQLRSGLVIHLRDINCWVQHHKRQVRGASNYTEEGMKWDVGCTIEFTNSRRVSMTDVKGTLELTLGEFEYSYRLGAFDLKDHASRKLFIPFGTTVLKFPVEAPAPAPDIPYRLMFVYTYAIDGMTVNGAHRTKVSGRLKKSDWIGEAEDLWRFRRIGFLDPR